jgi:hypothetical protein
VYGLGRGAERVTALGAGRASRELWMKDLDGYTVVLASLDGEAA